MLCVTWLGMVGTKKMLRKPRERPKIFLFFLADTNTYTKTQETFNRGSNRLVFV